jgi:endonuclease/exonuclease/phosphatase family metal-dependent hydrolase
MKTRRAFVTLCLVAAAAACMVSVSPLAAVPADNGKAPVRVMTRNMDAGTDLNYFMAYDFGTAVSMTVSEVLASDIPGRAALLAAEISEFQPDLVALQEVTTWTIGGQTFDQLAFLMGELDRLHQHYRVAEIQELTSIDITLAEVGYTDHDAILVRTDTGKLEVLGTEKHLYETLLPFPLPDGGSIDIKHGWIAADIRVKDSRFKFVTTHLESGVPGLPQLQQPQFAQAAELMRRLLWVKTPIILAGDFNSDAEPTHYFPPDATWSYPLISLFYTDAWQLLHPTKPGYTWPLFPEDDSVYKRPIPLERIDLIFSRGLKVRAIDRTGMDSPYASDHAGVVADYIM